MSAKVILVLCAQALFIQTAFSSCLGRAASAAPTLIAPRCAGNTRASNGLIGNGFIGNGRIGNGYAGNGVIGGGINGNSLTGNGLAGLGIIPTTGGGLPVSSLSGIGAPNGLSIASENVYEGALSVNGALPFVSTVALKGLLDSAGAGAVSYSCGNGAPAINSIAPSAGVNGAAGAYGASSAYGGVGAYGAGGAYGLGVGYGPGAAAIAPGAFSRGYGGCSCGRSRY